MIVRTADPQDAPAVAHLIATLASSLGDPSAVTPGYAAEALRKQTCSGCWPNAEAHLWGC